MASICFRATGPTGPTGPIMAITVENNACPSDETIPDDEILALVRNEVTDVSGTRTWVGRFVNTNSRTLRDVAVTVDFLNGANAKVGRVEAKAAELTNGKPLDMLAPLPPDAVRLRIYSVQWCALKTEEGLQRIGM